MTHGNVWIPLNGKMLFCEAWSDGYLDGVGFGALCSSKQIPTVSKLSEIFFGSPFFYMPSTNTYVAKEGDYLMEGYEDCIEDEKILHSAAETLELVLAADLEAALGTEFAKIDLKTRIAMDFGFNAELISSKTAWKDFVGDSIQLGIPEVCEIVVQEYVTDPDFDINYFTQYNYYWKDNQFLVKVEIQGKTYMMPLIIACAFSCDTQPTYGDLEYLKDMTQPDREALDILRKAVKKHGLPKELIFSGL